MKCLILAGGSGDSLWPLSRKNYPKQFMNIKEGRSLLQETVVRNMPFCDEFVIVTKESYRNIVNGQMKAFQSLKYRLILEGSPKGTAAAIMLGNMFCNQSELVFVVTADHLIEGQEYREAVLRGKELAKEGYVAAIGIKPTDNASGYDYIIKDEEDVLGFIERQQFDLKSDSYKNKEYLWNSGMYIYRVGDLINSVKNISPELYNTCRSAKRRTPAIRRGIRFSENVMKDIPTGSIEQIVFSKNSIVKVVEAEFGWKDVGNVSDLDGFGSVTHSDYVIKNNCEDVSVVNNAERQLVVTNDLNDIVVVNTEDAVYVSSVYTDRKSVV